jgi:4-alpha-glucanotransferase
MEKIERELSSTPNFQNFKKIGIGHHHGFCLPLFSIRSKDSCGIGEFNDLKHLIDWCREINMDVIQLLPLNECHYNDPSPYNSLSSCALDFIYLSLNSLPYADSDKSLQKKIQSLKRLNRTKRVKHKKVRKKKFKFLKEYYQKYFENFNRLDSYTFFVKENLWLKPYSVFRHLKDHFHGKKWSCWPKTFQNPSTNFIDAYYNSHSVDTNLYIFLQYLSFSELIKVKEYATLNKVFVEGDLPLLINPDSVDVWYYRSFFDLKKVAGAPPDDFCPKGQKWRFPLIDWEKLKNQNYFWWKQKLSILNNFFHIYRIDHAVGLFRIWSMEVKENPIYGQFIPADSSLWQKEGEEHLRMIINSSPLLPIAEDLGLIPTMVYDTLKKLGICGTKVIRWQTTIPLSDYEPLSLTTISTHDTENFGAWWKNYPDAAKTLSLTNHWEYSPALTPALRKKILFDVHHSKSLFHINLIQEYLALFPELTWKNPKNERINIPGKKKRKNWTYKCRPSIEEIISHKELKKTMKEIVQ